MLPPVAGSVEFLGCCDPRPDFDFDPAAEDLLPIFARFAGGERAPPPGLGPLDGLLDRALLPTRIIGEEVLPVDFRPCPAPAPADFIEAADATEDLDVLLLVGDRAAAEAATELLARFFAIAAGFMTDVFFMAGVAEEEARFIAIVVLLDF